MRKIGMYGRHHPYACQSRVADLLTGARFSDNEKGSNDSHRREELSVLQEYFQQVEGRQRLSHTAAATTPDLPDGVTTGDDSAAPACESVTDTAADSTVYHSGSASTGAGDSYIDGYLFAEEGVEVVLRPGDVLLIPPFWIHEVRSAKIRILCI